MHPATDLSRGDGTASSLDVRRYGRRSYQDARALQERAARSVANGARDRLLFIEHAPVITCGRGTAPEEMIASAAELAAAGIAVAETDRGGSITYHGPGQLVGYPIVDLRRRSLGVRGYLRALEAALITAVGSMGVAAYPCPGLTGVWTRQGKIAAIGIAVRRGVTRHGFALNVAPDMSGFEHIVPCGLRQPVVSLAHLGVIADPGTLQQEVATALAAALRAASPGLPADVGARPRTSLLTGARR